MNKRKVGILIITAGLVVLVAIIYFMFFYNTVALPVEVVQEKNLNQQDKSIKQIQTQSENKLKVIIEAKQPSEVEITQVELKMTAASFTERFGSFSNQSNYGNIRDLKIFMTSKMKNWADDFISQAIANKSETSIYYGITTKAIAQEIKQFDKTAGYAEVLVKTQRKEVRGNTNDVNTFYQDIIIKIIREKGVWKVDGAEWQN